MTFGPHRRKVRSQPLPAEFPGAHSIDEEEVEAAVRLLRSRSLYRYYGLDPRHETDQFEAEFAQYLGVRHVVAVTSGTAALHAALGALRVGPGDEVIVPSYMWVSVIAAVVNLGAIPVLAEIDESFGLDPEDVERRITPRTAGVIAVHMCGAPADVLPLREITRRHSLFLLEDCAQCAGGSIHGQKVGTFGDIAIFSFQTNKNMTVGEAGAIVTNDTQLYDRAVSIQDSGYARDAQGEIVLDDPSAFGWGRGVRLDELRAAVLRVQLRKIDRTIARMRQSKERIAAPLRQHPQIQLRRHADPRGDTSCFLLTIFPDAATARAMNRLLLESGIATFSPTTSNVILAVYGMHIYYNIPALVRKVGTDHRGFPWTLKENRLSVYDYAKGVCPRSDDLFERSLLLAIASCLTAEDEEQIMDAFVDALAEVFPTPEIPGNTATRPLLNAVAE